MPPSGLFLRRMKRELELLRGSASSPGVVAWPVDESRIDKIEGELTGAKETPYEGGTFRVEVHVPPEYPLKPPAVRFLTKIYHPNIDTEGRICLDTLNMPPKGAWKPSLNICTVLTSILALMSAPNPDDALMADISDVFRRDRARFDITAKVWTAKYAVPKGDVETVDNHEKAPSDDVEGDAEAKNKTAPKENNDAAPHTTPKKRSRLSRKSPTHVTSQNSAASTTGNTNQIGAMQLASPENDHNSPPNPISISIVPSPEKKRHVDAVENKSPSFLEKERRSPPSARRNGNGAAASTASNRNGPARNTGVRRTREILVEDSDEEEENDQVVVVEERKILITPAHVSPPVRNKLPVADDDIAIAQVIEVESVQKNTPVKSLPPAKIPEQPIPAVAVEKKKSRLGGRLKKKRRR